jgi:RNA polymerase sigma-70 factor (ECF subfamily)
MAEENPGVTFNDIREDLHRLARWLMERERQGHTLQPTALLGEVWIKLFADNQSIEGKGRAELIGRAVRAMRQILTDHARRRGAEKRGGDQGRVPLLDDVPDQRASRDIDELELEDALGKLAEAHPRPALAMNLRLTARFTIPEIAALLEFSEETIRKDLLLARAWLARELGRNLRNGP